MIPFVIDMMNSVQSLPTVLPTDFSDEIISLVTSSRHHFFCFVLIILFPTVITEGILTEGILPSVKSIGKFPTEIFPRHFHLYLLIFW